ncbi:sodium channel protein Nach-like [Anopheles ziemanni]|uniref:sodium channel protein Nach-like n=1 Tax=Anopheles coustani TaxID=139045 RepID=UPI0026590458|nr:sodium channel protein Nach-like [Anopheles coustani]XP_058178094.1 sodium channel protein Nach-like [Anopheles ziemanni]
MTLLQTFWVFCENSSLHGLRYIGRSNATRANLLLRFVWSLFALVSLAFTLMLASSAWDQFRSNPTLTTIETTTYPVSLIPFPSVTLCNINKIHSAKALEMSKMLMNLGMAENDTIDLLASLQRLNDYRPVDERILQLERFLNFKGYRVEQLAFDLAPPCETMVAFCFWLMEPVPCGQLFRRTKIFAGYCCSFNADGFLEPADIRRSNHDAKSIHVNGIGKGEGLTVVVDIGEANYTSSDRFTYGVEVFIHRSYDFPDYSDYTTVVQRGWETDVSVLPTIVSASPSLRSVPIERRGCAFSDEGNMSTTLPYTYSNCMNECEQRYVAEVCKCIPLFREIFELQVKFKVPICGFRDVGCLLKMKHGVSFTSAAIDSSAATNFNRSIVKCQCYPSCTTELNQVNIISNTINNPKRNANLPEFNFSSQGLLHVHFRSTNCLKYRREPFVTWQTLVATFGGIFGLCMGGSILSLVEMMYHFGITPFIVYQELKEQLVSRCKAGPLPMAHVPFPRRPPIGYFRRNEVIARAITQDGSTPKGIDKKNYANSPKWRQSYVDELKMIY